MTAWELVVKTNFATGAIIITRPFLAGNLSGGEVNLAYELLNIQQSIDGLMSILSLFIIHVALVHVRIE